MIYARLSFFFAAYFWVGSVGMTYWPVWLEHRGVDAVETGTIYMARQMITVLAILAIGVIASRLASVRPLLVLITVSASVVAATYQFAWGFVANLVVTLIWGVLWHPIHTLAEGITVTATRQHRIDYAHVRLWGSVSFIFAALAVGACVDWWGSTVILPVMCIGVLLTIAAVVMMPRPAVEPLQTGVRVGSTETVRRLMSDRAFLLFLVASGACQTSHSVLALVGTLSWRAIGISDSTISLLWSGCVIAEVVFFTFGGRLVTRFGPPALIAAGAVGGIVRWVLTPYTENIFALAALQGLHALTFSAAHLGAMGFLQRALGSSQMAIGQSLYYGLANGLLAAFMFQVSGWLYSRVGAEAYLAMALLCVISLVASALLARAWHGGLLADRAVNSRARADAAGA